MGVLVVKELQFTSPRTALCVATAEWTSITPASSAFSSVGVFRLRLLSGSIAENTPREGWVYTGANTPPNTTVDQVGPDGFSWCAANFVVRGGQVYTLRLEQQVNGNNTTATLTGLVLKARVYKR